MAADSASALWCSKRLFDNSAPPLTDRGCEGLPSHDCERIKQHQKRESRGDRVLHDPAIGLLSSHVQDRAIGLRPLSLRWHRQYLHSAFHFARITLHRAFLFRPSITNRFQTSRDACISSACADLKIKLSLHSPTMADRVKAHVGAHQLSNSALILGIITVQSPHGPQTDAILSDLQSYCYQQSNDSWLNEYGLAETRVVELCIVRAMQARQTAGLSQDAVLPSVSSRSAVLLRSDPASTGTATSTYEPFGPSHAANKQMGHCPSQISTDVQSWSFNDFPELTDFTYWEGLIDNLSGLASSHDG